MQLRLNLGCTPYTRIRARAHMRVCIDMHMRTQACVYRHAHAHTSVQACMCVPAHAGADACACTRIFTRMRAHTHGRLNASRSTFADGPLLSTSRRCTGAPTILSSQRSPLSARAATPSRAWPAAAPCFGRLATTVSWYSATLHSTNM